jgi:rhodanese-related sulfurtransferase
VNIPTVTQVPEGALLLDVRESNEWQAGHAPDAVHVPLGELPGRVAELPTGRTIVAICRMGGRSAKATAFLREHGLDVHNYAGGMQAWASAGGPLESSGSTAPTVI